jgi:hypothetical protein
MQVLVPVFCALLGALIYGISANVKACELGRLMYAAALIALMIALTNRTLHLF